ncbi:hypothetical protein ACFY30_05645 [Streptomyces sp. NPDC000345]|uniref:hypothetical protein n=1 Tax=Streptomyces sp. NPDC000345 TaxID=3364537 RepID=UPI0036A95562
MGLDQLPGRVREFANHLNGLLARLDQGAGWCAVFWQRDPDGMHACLDGREVPPWDVVEALLQDLAAEYGTPAAAQEAERVRSLHAAALAAYDARPGGRDALGDRLDVMLREQRYAAERQAELGRLLAGAATPEDAEAIRLDLAWAHDDHERAVARCAELRYRMAELDRRTAEGQIGAAPPAHRTAPQTPTAPAYGTSPTYADGTEGGPGGSGHDTWAGAEPGGPARRTGGGPGRGGPAYGTGPGSGPDGPAHGTGRGAEPGGPARDTGAGSGRGGPAYGPGSTAHPDPASTPAPGGAPAPLEPPAPEPEGAPTLAEGTSAAPGKTPLPKQRKRRRGGARFAGMAEEDDAPVVVPPAAGPALPAPAPATRRTLRGARFAGAADRAERRPHPQREPLDAEARQETVRAVERLVALRAEGRSGEAHALLVELAYWPAARIPLLAAELQRAGLSADWTTLLWEAASLPADRLVEAADALVAVGRTADGEQILRQGVARPAEEIGQAVLGLAEEGRRREVRALLDAYVRVRTPEEAARSAAPDPQTLVPLLLESARRVSEQRHWDLVHALRVAGFTT